MFFWLSFCDPDRPRGSQFLGVSIVEADDPLMAVSRAWQLGCNPGGEIQIEEIPEFDNLTEHELQQLSEIRDRLLCHQELCDRKITSDFDDDEDV